MGDEFQRWGQGEDEDIDLLAAALAIAADEYPDLDPAPWRARVDALADTGRSLVDREGGALAALDHVLFSVEGFSGDTSSYYDPRNSYLNDVLERRVGIPITLSLLYVEVGRRMDLALEPVAFPGHFLVCALTSGAPLVIDPFDRGRRLGPPDLIGRLAPLVGGEDAAHDQLPRLLVPAPRREVVARMLRNLKAIYAGKEDWERTLRVIDRLVAIAPGVAQEVRDRGYCCLRLEAFSAALADLRRYLALAPDAADAAQVREVIAELERRATRLN